MGVATSILGGLGGISAGSAAATPTAARSATVSDNVFLGGDFLELGILPNGGFGANVTAPSEFYGSQRTGGIGMYADFDGFANDATDFQYDYFLPGSPEERFSVGYKESNGTIHAASNGRSVGTNISPTTVTDTSSGDTLSANVSSTFDGVLRIDQTYRFSREDEFYTLEVRVENVGSETLNDVRYQRSVDPDNGVDVGCDFTTKNTVVDQLPGGSRALVKAEIWDGDDCALADFSTVPMFYQSTDDRARVSYGSSGLVPSSPPYGAADYENAPGAGSTVTADAYIAITYALGDLAAGDATSFRMATGLTANVDDTLEQIENPASPDEVPARRARFKVVEGSVTPRRAEIGELVTMTATVQNVGTRRGDYLARFQDDTRVYDSAEVTLEPDESHTFEFTVTYDEIGTNRLFVNEWNVGEVRVVRPQAPTLDQSDLTVLEASLTRTELEPGDRFAVVATVRNDADVAGIAPVTFSGSPTAPGGSSVEATQRGRLGAGSTGTFRHEVRVPRRTDTGYDQRWTVNGVEAGTASITVPEDQFATGGDGIVDAFLSERSVAPGETYRVVAEVRNGTTETNTYGLAFRRGSSLKGMRAVRLAPGDRETVAVTMTAPDAPGRTIDWHVSDVSAGRLTVER